MSHERYPGAMHALIFWGMVILFVATSLDAVEFNAENWFGWHLASRRIGVQLELVWDIGGMMLIAGVGLAAFRRYVLRPPRLNTLLENGVLLALLFSMAVSGFVLQSLRMAATELEPSSELYSVASAYWSPFSYVIAVGIRATGATVWAMEASHFWLWWAHAALMSATFVYAAWRFGPLMHIFVSPLNLVMRSSVTRPKGALRPMGDLDTLETFGARELTQLTSKQLLDYDSCTNCGRCQDQCPAWRSGKPLSPRKLVQDAKAYMVERAPALLAEGPDAPPPPAGARPRPRIREPRGAVVVHHVPRLHGGVPRVRRAHRLDRGHAPLPDDGGGGRPGNGDGRADLDGAARASVARRAGLPR